MAVKAMLNFYFNKKKRKERTMEETKTVTGTVTGTVAGETGVDTVESRLKVVESEIEKLKKENDEKIVVKCACGSSDSETPWYESDFFYAGVALAATAAVGYLAYKTFFDKNDEGVTINLGD
jgi:hypothetical protein